MLHTLKKTSLVITFAVAFTILSLKLHPVTNAQTGTACQPTFALQVPTAVPAGGTVPVNLSSTTASTKTVQDVMFTIDSSILGRGVQVTANMQWQMQWYAQYSSPASHTIGAQLTFSDGTGCFVPSVPVNLTGTATTGAHFTVAATPASYTGLTNQVVNFTLKAGISSTSATGIDVTQYAYFQKKPISIGSLTPLDGTAAIRYSTGPAAGSGVISVDVSYGGIKQTISIPVTVQGAPTVTPTPSPGSNSGGTNTGTGSSSGTSSGSTPGTNTNNTSTTPTDTTAAAASAASIEAEPAVKDCVLSALGQARYDAIRNGLGRPTAAEFDKINKCFETRNYVLPSGFVPVSPTEVKNQPVSKDVTVEKPANETQGKTTKLKFNGKSKPNAVVLLYVYSEPMVLSTTSDNSGNWSYTLEDPLQPGNHEMYAVVDKGDGTYERSQPIGFGIASAEASTANPNGYSLKLGTITATAKDKSTSSLFYIGGVVLLVLLMLGIGFGVMRKRRKKPVATAPSETIAPTAEVEGEVPTTRASNSTCRTTFLGPRAC
jgi:hypothetical protein